MSLVDQVTADMKDAMRAKDKVRLSALRNLRAAFLDALKQPGVESLPEDDAIVIVRKLAKKHEDSIASYGEGGRDDLVAEEQAQLDVMSAYLPKLADEATTAVWVDEAIAATGATSAADMGKVMGALMKAHRTRLDGKLAQQFVRARLNA